MTAQSADGAVAPSASAPPCKRMRFSGLPPPGHILEVPDLEEEPCSTSEATGKAVLFIPADSISEKLGSTNAELLQLQLDAVEDLYRVYKVEHYAVLEEMRLVHRDFSKDGKCALKAETDSGLQDHEPSSMPAGACMARGSAEAGIEGGGGSSTPDAGSLPVPAHAPPPMGVCTPPTPAPPCPMRELLSAMRARDAAMRAAIAAPASAQAVPLAPLATQTQHAEDPAMQAPADAAAAAPSSFASPPPSTSKLVPPGGGATCGDSPAGVSLNAWVRPSGSCPANSTPTGPSASRAAAAAVALREGRGEHGHTGAPGASLQGDVGDPADAPKGDAHDTSRDGGGSGGGRDARYGDGGGSGGGRDARYGDAVLGYGSDEDPGEFTDLEEAVLQEGASCVPYGVTHESPAVWRRRFSSCAADVFSLEAAASGITQSALDASGALACLVGRSGRWLLRRGTVLLGRGSETKGAVDVDLGPQGAAPAAPSKVSRRQAYVSLRPDGTFLLENVGRRPMHVDGAPCTQFESVPLGHLSLLEVGGVRLLFMINMAAIARVLRRSARLTV